MKTWLLISSILAVLGISFAMTTNCSWLQKHSTQLDCALLDTVEDAPQLLTIVESCYSITISSNNIAACISAAASDKWVSDVRQCFQAAVTQGTEVPAVTAAKIQRLKVAH